MYFTAVLVFLVSSRVSQPEVFWLSDSCVSYEFLTSQYPLILVHAGCIIQTMDDSMADELEEMFREIEDISVGG